MVRFRRPPEACSRIRSSDEHSRDARKPAPSLPGRASTRRRVDHRRSYDPALQTKKLFGLGLNRTRDQGVKYMAVETKFQPGIWTGRGNVVARLTTETKQAFKTTEFWAMVLFDRRRSDRLTGRWRQQRQCERRRRVPGRPGMALHRDHRRRLHRVAGLAKAGSRDRTGLTERPSRRQQAGRRLIPMFEAPGRAVGEDRPLCRWALCADELGQTTGIGKRGYGAASG